MPREVLHPLASRFDAALGAVLTAAPEAFRHSELDAEANRAQLEQLCERVEQVASRQPAMAGAASVAQLADQLRERLAANTIGGRADDETKWKTHEYDVRAAQDAWQRVGYVPDSVAAPLAARFQRAVQRFYGEKKPGAPETLARASERPTPKHAELKVRAYVLRSGSAEALLMPLTARSLKSERPKPVSPPALYR